MPNWCRGATLRCRLNASRRCRPKPYGIWCTCSSCKSLRVASGVSDAITVQDLDGRTLAWNPGAARLYGWSEAQALAMNVRDRIPPALRMQALATLAQLSRSKILEPYRTQRLTEAGAVIEVSMVSTALVNEAGPMYAIATTERAHRPAD